MSTISDVRRKMSIIGRSTSIREVNSSELLECGIMESTFNVGDIYADDNWNKNRWKDILKEIVSRDADIVILHEIAKDSAEIFVTLNDYGYRTYIPYVNREQLEHKRDNWEVIYCKISRVTESSPISWYIPLSMHEGLSCVRCIIDDGNEINICSTTWNPITHEDLQELCMLTSQFLDQSIPLLMSVSSNRLGSLIIPPKGIIDVWTKLGSQQSLAVTINENICTNFVMSCRRGDHIWVSGIIPEYISMLVVENGSEHNGLLTKYKTKETNIGRENLRRSKSIIGSLNNRTKSLIIDEKYGGWVASFDNEPQHSHRNLTTDKVKKRSLSVVAPSVEKKERLSKQIAGKNQCLIM